MNIDEALDELKRLGLGLSVVITTVSEYEQVSTDEVVKIIERRGDYDQF